MFGIFDPKPFRGYICSYSTIWKCSPLQTASAFIKGKPSPPPLCIAALQYIQYKLLNFASYHRLVPFLNGQATSEKLQTISKWASTIIWEPQTNHRSQFRFLAKVRTKLLWQPARGTSVQDCNNVSLFEVLCFKKCSA